jgi:hypothetical protein
MNDPYDEYGGYEPSKKSSSAYWCGWGATALALFLSALGSFRSGSIPLGIGLLAGIPLSFWSFHRYRRRIDTKLPD